MGINHRYIRKLMLKIGKGKAKIYVDIVAKLGNHRTWQPVDKNDIAHNAKVPIKQVNKAIRKLKKSNIIRYRAGYARYTPQLLDKKSVLINKAQNQNITHRKHRHKKIKHNIKNLFKIHKKK